MKIRRDSYLERIISKMHTKSIKIVTGIRRCGKSYLLFNLFYDHLRSTGVDDDHILRYQLDDLRNKDLRDAYALYYEIMNRITDESMYYILIDEIQLVPEFHEILNSFLHISNVDVYVTGSNSKFLSKDIVTEFRGRSTEIRLRPLSFSEYVNAVDMEPMDALEEFMDFGGMPEILQYPDEESKTNYLKSLISKVYLTDIIERNSVDHEMELEKIVELLCSSIGSLNNVKKITDTLRTEMRSNITDKTVKRYMEHLCDSFLFEESKRYDVKGRKYFSTNSKFYIADIGLKNAKENFRQNDRPHIMENIIFNELRCRGYDVDVGVVETTEVVEGDRKKKALEIDFVANHGNLRIYIQSAYSLDDETKRNTELRPFLKVNDSFKKVIVQKDYLRPRFDDNGILHIGLLNFLMDPNSIQF